MGIHRADAPAHQLIANDQQQHSNVRPVAPNYAGTCLVIQAIRSTITARGQAVVPAAGAAPPDEEELLQEADAQHEAAVRSALQATDDDWQLLSQMQEIAQAARYEPDSRVRRLEQLIRQHLCPRLGQAGAEWASERLLIFTEYADTKDWLERRVRELIAGSDQAEARIATFHGGIGEEAARFIKVLEEQRKRITSTRSRTNENLDQLLLDLGGIKEQRLQSIDRTFALQAHRVEPAGAIDLWPTDLHCTDVMYKP